MGSCTSKPNEGVPNSKSSDTYSGSSFKPIGDHYKNFDDVQNALQRNGLESCNLIVGIDFTKSNEWTGELFIFFSILQFYYTNLIF